MKNTLISTLFTLLLVLPFFASADTVEIFEDEYLNVANSIGQETDTLNIESTTTSNPSDLNQWGSNWGNKVPFKANTSYGIAAYGVEIQSYFPKR